MRSFPEVNYRQCHMNMLFDNSATDKEVLSEGILQSRFLGKNLFKGAPSTSVHCGRALHRNHLLNVEITNVLIVFENRIVSSQPNATAGCDTLLKRNRCNPVIKHRTHVRIFCITVNDFGEVRDRNTHWLKVPL